GDVLALRGRVELHGDADHPEGDRAAPDRSRHGVLALTGRRCEAATSVEYSERARRAARRKRRARRLATYLRRPISVCEGDARAVTPARPIRCPAARSPRPAPPERPRAPARGRGAS